MKIYTKQICFDSDLNRTASFKPAKKVSHRANRVRRFAKSGSLVMAVGLAIALTACGGTPTAEQPSVEGSTTAEAIQPSATQDEPANKVFATGGVAIGGADPVAYFTEESYIPGSADYAYEWQGATWQFASAESRDLFTENPEQYAPEYGGFCAWAIAAKNTLVPIDPNAWSVVDGKLYLNANKKVQNNWLKDVPGFISEANGNWPALSQS